MRRTCSDPRALAALSFVVLAAGCPEEAVAPPANVVDEGSAKAKPEKQRPPFPNMATAAWGSSVIEEMTAGVAKEGEVSAHLSSSLQALHSLDEGAGKALVKSATSLFASAESDGDRALGAALAAVGLVLEPSADGYKERLTDAHGLAAFAGTLEGGTAVAQAARAFVAISAGRVFEGQKLVDVMSTSSHVDADSSLLLALSRFTLGQRNDKILEQARGALDDKPESARARALLARTYLDLGLPDEALLVLEEGKAALGDKLLVPPLLALRGRAQLRAGNVDEGKRTLEAAMPQLAPTERGEAEYWLARTLASSGDVPGATALHSRLSSQPGFAAEAALLDAILADARGENATDKALKLCTTRGLFFTVALDCLWTATEFCAAAGDSACALEWGKKAVGADDDFARLAHVRAMLTAAGKGPLEGRALSQLPLDDDTKPHLIEAHLLSPFDAALAKRLTLDVSAGGEAAARLVRGARRARAFGASKAGEAVLTRLSKEQPGCRVCRAVLAETTSDADEAAKRAAAALSGKGPDLAERDLIAVIDALGGSSVDVAKAALEKLAKDPRPSVQAAVQTAKKDQQNPEARQARKAESGAKPPAPGTVPVPGSTGHGEHKSTAHGEHE